MKLSDFLESAIQSLAENDIPTAKLDAELILADALQVDRSWVQTHPEHILQGLALQKVDKQIKRRAEHEPLAYIRGKSEFYGYEFFVNNHTLQPRPETETLVELLVNQISNTPELNTNTHPLHIVDVGTGSGCIAITIKRLLPKAIVAGTDIDQKCLKVALKNAQKQQIDVHFYQGDLLKALPEKSSTPDIIATNLPYVPNDFQINRAASHEPRHAIFGGNDGLDAYRQLFLQITHMSKKPSLMFTEALPPQHRILAEIAAKYSYYQIETQDFIQVFSVKNV